MTNKILHRLLVIMCAGLLHVSFSFGQTSKPSHDDPQVAPIELSEITLAYAVPNEAGVMVWETPKPDALNAIPSGARKLRFTAKVNNRPTGSKIRIRVILQELCPSPDAGKSFLAGLRHLTETDPTGIQTVDTADNEVQLINPEGRISIEIPVHCEDCGKAICGKACPDKDHLGEGPHWVVVTTSDSGLEGGKGSRKKLSVIAKPSSLGIDIISVCPKEEKKAIVVEKSDRL